MSSGPPTVFGNPVVRVPDLPDASLPLTNDEFVAISQFDPVAQKRRLRKTTTGQLLANHLAAADPHPQYASGQAVQDALDAAAEATLAAAAAVAAAAEAVSAAATTNGVVVLGTTTGTSTAYEVTAALGAGAGKVGKIIFHVTNGPNPTLTWNGTTRSLRQSDGVVLPTDAVLPNTEYLLTDTGVVFRLFEVNDNDRVLALIEAVRSGIFQIRHKQPGDAQPRTAIQFVDDGRIVMRTGGDGVATLSDEVFIIDAQGDVRAGRGSFLDRTTRPLYGGLNPPPPESTTRQLLQQFGGSWWELTATATGASGTRPYFVSGYDVTRGMLRLPAGTIHVFFEQMPQTSAIVILASANAVFDSGWTGWTWQGTSSATRLAITPGWWRVYKGFGAPGTLVCEPVSAHVATSAAALPSFAAEWCGLGQSWPNRGILNWIYGIQKKRTAIGLNRDVFIHQGTAFGASDLLKGTTSDPNNYYWDQDTDSPGPNYLAMMAAIAAAPGAGANLTDVVVMYGLNGMLTFADTGNNTPAIRIAMQLSMQAQMRLDLGLPGLRFWIVPLTSQQVGTFAENKWWAMRQSQLDTIDQDPDGLTFRAPESYDLPRPFGDDNFRGTDDRHYGFYFQALHGARIAAAIANVAHSQTNWLGPRITGFARTAARTYEVSIDWGPSVARNRPLAPVGFAVLPGTDPFATPLVITGFSLSGDNYIISTATDSLTATLAYPYGSNWEAEAKERVIGALDATSAEFWPLQTYHPSV